MSGRYAFSLPEPRQRDGWFRLGTLDVTTTLLVVLLGLASMLLYAIDPQTMFKGAFESGLVRDGEVWRLVTWPLVSPPDIWVLIGLAIFWYFGNQVEEDFGRKPFAVLLAVMAVIPGIVAASLGVTNDLTSRWSVFTFGISAFTLALLTIFGIEHPNARFFFGIPAWVIAAAFIFIEALQNIGARTWAQLIMGMLVIVIGVFGARQRGMLDSLEFIPRFRRLAGPARSPYGEIRSAKPGRLGRFRRGKGSKPSASRSGSGAVVAGPWGAQLNGPTPLEQAELDVLLDKISAGGIDSLTKQEKDRLNALSKRMRGT